MRKSYFILILSGTLFLSYCSSKKQESKTNDSLTKTIEKPYLSQKLPGLIPEVFAHGMVSTKHRDLSAFFTPDMKEFYFTRKFEGTEKWFLIVYKLENNQWKKSVVGPRVGRPIIAPNGKIMHLGSKYMERTQSGWSEIKSLGAPFDSIPIMRLTASTEGTYVFDEIGMPNGDGVIRYSRLIDGKRDEPKPFPKEINTGKWNAHPFIAPDESYIIWDGERDNGYGDSDLYISFRNQEGSWGTAINMGDKINTNSWESGGYVSPDGKYFFFNHGGDGDGDIFWVDAQVIQNLRPK
ncbi:hypothetical protein D1818_02290 [Aquimarina sp. BL5]|uniref:TolB family protein n=1 Tax=Aquimarina sp. BL5 TaxID=1714860 RepID=UPI000E498B50|nr:PD40 domain-containing protein [Aquimarina sp. BL5]AXT49703.1 hypothetical protein D1818_02290 [Aquimarina sp. BL5]RKN04290.1 hypothetical protein D7036_12475 [Aquimarina sp. BL5]